MFGKRKTSGSRDEKFLELLRAAKLILTTTSRTREYNRLFGYVFIDPMVERFYLNLILYKSELIEELKKVSSSYILFDGFVTGMLRRHVLIHQGNDDTPSSLHNRPNPNFLGSADHHNFVMDVLKRSDQTLTENPTILFDIAKLLPQYSIIASSQRERYFSNSSKISLFCQMYNLLLEKFAIHAKSIVKHFKSTNASYSIYDILDSTSKLFCVLREVPRNRVIFSALKEFNYTRYISGMIMSLECVDLSSAYPFHHSHQFLPCDCVATFWRRIGVDPDFTKLDQLVKYLASSIILMTSENAISPDSVGIPDAVGVNNLSDFQWSLLSEHFRVHVFNITHFSVDINDVKISLTRLRSLNFPFESNMASQGVLSGFQYSINKVNNEACLYLGRDPDDNRFQREVDILRKLTKYPIRITNFEEVSPGGPYDLTKSRAFLLLAEYGFTISDQSLESFLDSNLPSEPIEMPYRDIANFINYAYGQFLCLRFESELNKYSFDKEGNHYHSNISGVSEFVDAVMLFFHQIPDSYCRKEISRSPMKEVEYQRTINEVFDDDIQLVLDRLNLLFGQSLPRYELLDQSHRTKVYFIAIRFVLANLAEGSKVLLSFDHVSQEFTPMKDITIKRAEDSYHQSVEATSLQNDKQERRKRAQYH